MRRGEGWAFLRTLIAINGHILAIVGDDLNKVLFYVSYGEDMIVGGGVVVFMFQLQPITVGSKVVAVVGLEGNFLAWAVPPVVVVASMIPAVVVVAALIVPAVVVVATFVVVPLVIIVVVVVVVAHLGVQLRLPRPLCLFTNFGFPLVNDLTSRDKSFVEAGVASFSVAPTILHQSL